MTWMQGSAFIVALLGAACAVAVVLVARRPRLGIHAWVALLPFQFDFLRAHLNLNFAPADLIAVGLIAAAGIDLLRGHARLPMARSALAGVTFILPLTLSLVIGLWSGTVVAYALFNKWLGYLFLALTALAIVQILNGDFRELVRVLRTFLAAVLLATIVSVGNYWLSDDVLWVWSAVQSNRLAGTLVEAPPFGALLVVAFLIQTALLLAGIRVLSPWLDWISTSLVFHAILLTFSRSVWVGLAAGSFVLLTAIVRNRQSLNLRRVGSVAAVMLVVAAATFAAGIERVASEQARPVVRPAPGAAPAGAGATSSYAFSRFFEEMVLRRWTAGIRYTQFSEGLQWWADSPVAGIGLGRFLAESPRWFGQPYQIHNTYVWVLVEMGVVGLLWFLAFAWMVGDDYASALRRRPDRRWWVVGFGAAFASTLGFMIGNEGLYQRPVWLLVAAAAVVAARGAGHGGAQDAAPRVLQVVTRLNVGGITNQVILLAEQLARRGYVSEIAAGEPAGTEGNRADQARAAGVHVHDIRHLSNRLNPYRDIRAFFELLLLFRRARPDVVHLYMLKARLLGALAARLAGVPVVVETLHGNLLQGYYNRLWTAMIVACERFIGWVLVDRVIAPTSGQRDELLQSGIAPPERLIVQLPGVDVSAFHDLSEWRGRLRRRLGLSDAAVLVGVMGRLVPIKGIDVFLGAVARVKARTGVDAFFVIAGDGPLRQELEAHAARLELTDRCLFLGEVSEVRDFYADCDVVVLSSRNEGAPIALLEAMGAGRSIAATRVGGVADMVEDRVSALLVPAEDPDALGEALSRLVSDPESRARMGRAAWERTPHFSIDQFVGGTDRMYRELV